MPLRFIDTGFYKHPFIAGLKGPYKALYIFILCDCDNAGMWGPDFQIASIYIDQKLDRETARKNFAGKFIELKNGKWFFPDFIQWQYPKGLSAKNPAHTKIILELQKLDLIDENLLLKGTPKGLPRDPISPSEGTKDMDKDKVVVTGMGMVVIKGDEEEPKEIPHRYVQSIREKCKNIITLPQQLTNEEAEKLETRYGDAVVEEIFAAMENYKELKKKYQSVYLTAISWIKLREEKKKNGTYQKTGSGSIINTFK